jgi:hypothetical protein
MSPGCLPDVKRIVHCNYFRSLRTWLEVCLYFSATPCPGASSSTNTSPSSDCKTRWRCGAPADQRRSWRCLAAHFYRRRGPVVRRFLPTTHHRFFRKGRTDRMFLVLPVRLSAKRQPLHAASRGQDLVSRVACGARRHFSDACIPHDAHGPTFPGRCSCSCTFACIPELRENEGIHARGLITAAHRRGPLDSRCSLTGRESLLAETMFGNPP